MIKNLLWTTVIVIMFLGYLVWERHGATRDPKELLELEINLVKGKCTQPEMINRHFLQQSWFYDNGYTELAGAFGQNGFSLYQQGNDEPTPLEGAFCIEGKNLHVKYFKRHFVQMNINLSEKNIQFGTKLEPLGEDTFTVKEIDAKHMVLFFSSDRAEHIFYRKN